jgi:hypothetical protein
MCHPRFKPMVVHFTIVALESIYDLRKTRLRRVQL